MRQPEFLPTSVPAAVQQTCADVRETHIAAVFLIGDHAYKLKKPVDVAFLAMDLERLGEPALGTQLIDRYGLL